MAKGRGANRPRFRLVPTVLLTLAILLVPTAMYAWGRSSSSFTIDKVVVTGADLVPQRSLQRLLRREYLGRNLFTVTTDDVRGTLKSMPYVARATIDRDFPTTLHVNIEEHQPVAYVLADDRWYVVAADAHVISALKSASETTATVTPPGSAGGEDLAVLGAGPAGAKRRLPRMAAAGRIEVGQDLDDPGARLAVNVIAALTGSLRDRLAVVVVDDGRVTLRFNDGLLAEWGEEDRGAAKTMALLAVLAHYDKHSIDCTFIDVSAPDRVLARPTLE